VIRVLVVEDDFRVAQLHVTFTHRVPGFRVVGTAGTAAEARGLLAGKRPDLLLLDAYLPDESGLDLLAAVDVDTIVLTAASDPATVRTALARGALNYLVKPFTADQLVDRLSAYARYRGILAGAGSHISQEDIDRAVRHLHEGNRPATPKGQSAVTARLVADALRNGNGQARTAADIAAELGIARATAQRYLAALAQTGSATMSLRYGSTGRPEHLYRWAAG
jgi:two-component system CitB family response regulator